MKKVIVISPHPDDKTLGCGGTLLKYKIWNAKKINFKDDKKNYFLKKCKNCYIVLLSYEIVK